MDMRRTLRLRAQDRFLLLVGGVLGVTAASDSNFIRDFYDEENVREYVVIADSLRRVGLNSVYQGVDQFRTAGLSKQFPTIDTSNGIRMIYSVVEVEESYHHYFSLSASQYLPSRYAKDLTALFCLTADLQVPDTLWVSQNYIYHYEQILSRVEQQMLEGRLSGSDSTRSFDFFLKAFMCGITTETAPFHVQEVAPE